MKGLEFPHVVIGLILLVVSVILWSGWIFVGPDGKILTGKDRPSYFQFYITMILRPIKVFGLLADWRKW